MSFILELPHFNKNMTFYWRGRFSGITFTAVLIQTLLHYKDIALVTSFKMFGFNELIVHTRGHPDFFKNFVYCYCDVIHAEHISIIQEFHRGCYFY